MIPFQQDSFIINEIRVEGVEDNAKPSAAASERLHSAAGEHDATTSSSTDPTQPGCPAATAPKKKRGRKSNFEKGLPFMVRGKVVSGHLSMDADQKLTSGEYISCSVSILCEYLSCSVSLLCEYLVLSLLYVT